MIDQRSATESKYAQLGGDIRIGRIAIILAVVLLLGPASLLSQTYYGTIRGTATDLSRALVVGAKVTITNLDTNIRETVYTNQAGNYAAPNLIPGNYRVSAESPGFKEFVAENVLLEARADRRVDLRFELGAVTETVTVSAGAQLIETESAAVSDVKSNYVFTNMAVVSNYRSIWRMLTLTPGATGSSSAGNSRGYNATYTIDGIPVKDGWTGSTFGPAYTYLDSFREFRMDSTNTNATSGTTANISVISESGTNEIHGEGWLHYNALGFYARDFFSSTAPHGPPIFRPNVKAGGPVYLGKLYDGRNRTFFHGTWQGLRGSQSPNVANFVVPTQAFRNGDFSSLSTQIVDPTTGIPFTNNRIPANRISSVSKYYQDTFYPLPNSETDRFRDTSVFPNTSDYYAARGDHRVSDKHSFFGRFMRQEYEYERHDGNYNPKIGIYRQWRNQHHVVLSDTYTVSATVLNELRAGYARDESAYSGPRSGLDVVSASGLQLKDLQDSAGLPRMDITGFNSIYQGDQNGWLWSNFHVLETLHWIRGKHNFRFGAEWAKFNGKQYATSPSRVFGTFGFDGRFSGAPYADFLLGLMNSSSRNTSVGPVYPRRSNWEFYVTDDFKVTPRLTLNFGLRYSLLDPGTVDQDLIASFSPQHNALLVPTAAALNRVHPGFPANVPIKTAESVGIGRGLAHFDKNNFAPRFGFAWRPERWDDLVIRGGVGVYYYSQHPHVSEGGGAPFELAESFTNRIVNGVPDFSFPRPFPETIYVLGGTSTRGIDSNFRTPYTTQYSLTVEKQFGDMAVSATYLSTLARKNPWNADLNQVPANETPYAEKLPFVPFPYVWSASYRANGGNHNYHGGILKAERKTKGGLYYQAHITWAKNMGDDHNSTPENAFDRRREYSQGGDVPHIRTVILGIYELPLGRGKRFGSSWPKALDYLLGGWATSGTYILQSGQYFSPSYSGVDAANTNDTSGLPDRIADGNLSQNRSTEEKVKKWFDTAAFVRPPAGIGRYGSSGAYILEGPPLNVFHFGVNKQIPINERVAMKLEAVSTDFFNHPNFRNPSGSSVRVGTSSFGRLTRTQSYDGARTFQFTLRLTF